MGNSQPMKKIDFSKENLKTEYVYSKYFEAKNLERYLVARKLLYRNRITFSVTLVIVVGIYFTTISKIKQESFLDNFDEPERVPGSRRY